MPIYAYKCESCGHTKDVLQKMSDAPLTDCPQCGAAAFKKQLTAAGFQLKGSGWYVTDFRGGSQSGAPAVADVEPVAAGKPGDSATPAATQAASSTATNAKVSVPAPAATSSVAASSPAPAKGAS